jgi:chemotaxis protein histidine kinase CheA
MARQQPIELFMPPNILKAKAGGGRGGLDKSAMRRAESAVQELKSEFHGWAAAELDTLAAARDLHAKNPTAQARGALLRAAHDLGGHAAGFGFPLVARIAASLSRLLAEVPVGQELPAGLVDAHVDAAQVIFRENIADEGNEIARLLCAELDARAAEALERILSPRVR